ncbi:LAME_0G03334g1_1 [Lachancea meyersii CBS 8951]|uniref:LAME_0G03334g1_1 n=1 Tax=Lachancea meyersii CBS 8951 TaxID=1266667 RepID=A0A1G4K6I2_9SACH|nr:LAME_0G03334g1_1 [Lachancea meyersii CBS 8951]
MAFPTTPLFATSDRAISAKSSIYEVTPTKPLDLNQHDASWLRDGVNHNEGYGSQHSPRTDRDDRQQLTNLRHSTVSFLNSASELSFETAYQSEAQDDEDSNHAGTGVVRPDSTLSAHDTTPIVIPSSQFGTSTPHVDAHEFQINGERHSPDSFDFVEAAPKVSNNREYLGLGLPSLELSSQRLATSGVIEGTKVHHDSSTDIGINAQNTSTSPSKISKRYSSSSKTLARKSIYEAHAKQPVETPTASEKEQETVVQTREPNENSTFSEDSTFSNDDSYVNRLNQGHESSKKLERKHTFKKSSELDLDESNLAYLFIIAIHSFNSQTLRNKDDVAICLSFEKNDVAFVHTVDESGWGEVTLVSSQKRGWVPFNYFSDMIGGPKHSGDTSDFALNSPPPLAKLLSSAARFLLHPQDHPLANGSGISFNLQYINGIRDGVKFLLESTGCVSRSNELVKNRATLRRSRKMLLADWYNLMIKADSYKYTTDEKRIETLTNLTFQVLGRGHAFYCVWYIEKQAYQKEKNLGLAQPLQRERANGGESDTYEREGHKRSVVSNSADLPTLKTPPFAVQRLNEVHDLLFSYIALVLGRMDMIEHNAAGCEILETIIHQVIILLRELLYISKCCSSVVQAKFPKVQRNETSLDQSLDPLLSLVSELVSCIKVFVVHSINENNGHKTGFIKGSFINSEEYVYTDSGRQLMVIVAKMTGFIGVAIQGCHHYLNVAGNFQLVSERSYPDFELIKITSDQFIRRCSIGLAKAMSQKRRDVHTKFDYSEKNSQRHPYSKKLYRYSMVRGGGNGITFSGTHLLQHVIPDNVPFIDDKSFDKFKLSESDLDSAAERDAINDRDKIRDELVFDKEDRLIGASHRALVFVLTDELNRPSDFLTATYLLNYRSFSSPLDFIAELITRFDIPDKSSTYERDVTNGQYSSRSSRLKNRRRMVCHIFQTWMESYWNYQRDFSHLTTMINFFNEGVAIHLPLEARNLIEVAAKLVLRSTVVRQSATQVVRQLSPRDIVIPSRNSIISLESTTSSKRSTIISVDEHVLEDYELTKLPSARTSSISIPLPMLNVGTSSLLGRKQIIEMERLTKNYRSILYPSGSDFDSNGSGGEVGLDTWLSEWSTLVQNSFSQTSPVNLVHNDLNLVELNPLEVAKQFSLIESAMFVAVNPGELLNQNPAVRKKNSSACPDIELIIDFSNLLSNYVIESIVAPKLALKARVNRLTAWLSVALSSLYFRNFNSVATIMTALQSHILARLTSIWDSLSDKHAELFRYLSKIIHPSKNYNVYRAKLQKLATGFVPSDNLSAKCHVPLVPFFALFLQDLTSIQEGLHDFRDPSSFRPNRLINVEKFTKVTKTLSLLQFFQVSYDTNDRPNILGSGRESFFNLNSNSDIDTTRIKPVALLQKFILYELWRVNLLYSDDSDRGYKLSLTLAPRNEP